MSARFAAFRVPTYLHQEFDVIFGTVDRPEFDGWSRAIIIDEPIGAFTDEGNVKFYGGHLACESVASREIGEIIIRALNEAIASGELK